LDVRFKNVGDDIHIVDRRVVTSQYPQSTWLTAEAAIAVFKKL
jgi:hypothetical protein